MKLLCPICSQPLEQTDRTMQCPNRHCFDIARQGYVNLLPVQDKHSRNPGDTAQQVIARRSFLESGFYEPISAALQEMAAVAAGPILDIGCGEGYYSSRLAKAMGAELVGLDISKEAVRYAAARYKDARWICGSAARLPVEDHSVGLITSLFALTIPEEFHRVLRPDGHFIQVLAAPDHLLGLKSIIYDQLISKPKDTTPNLAGFTLEKTMELRFPFTVTGQQVQNLLSMTPHVYRISKDGADRLAQTQTLTDTASCVINLLRPTANFPE